MHYRLFVLCDALKLMRLVIAVKMRSRTVQYLTGQQCIYGVSHAADDRRAKLVSRC
jgi:hypothetical protein